MIERKLRKFLIPNTLAMIGISCYVLADTFFISTAAGANGITALNLALPIYGVMFAIGSMIGVGSATRYSLCKAVGDKKANAFFSNSIMWSVIISLIFVFFGVFAPDLLLRLMGADDIILETGLSYIRTALLFAPFFMLNYTFTAFARNDGAPKIAMAATLLSSLFNIIFDYVFMFPMQMGMTGAALATGISPIVSISICMLHYLSKNNTIRFSLCVPSIKKLLLSCNLGIASFVGEISNAVTNMVFNFILLGLIGNIAVAAYGVVANLAIVGIAVFNGIAQGLQPMASSSAGKNDKESQKRIYKHSLKIGFALAAAIVILLWIFPEQVVAVFNSENSAQMADYAVTGLRLYSLGFLLAVVNIIKAGFYSAIGYAKECSLISVSRGIVAIVIFAFLLSRFWGIIGVWLAFPAAELFTLMLSLFYTKMRQNTAHNSSKPL